MSDIVLEGQQWLNATYGDRSGYLHVEETGLPGTSMSQALVSAMQIELGVSPVTGTFGPLTTSLCDSYPLSKGDYGNRVKIIQYGLHSKGYNPGIADSSLGDMCVSAIKEIQQDAGLEDSQISDIVRGLQAGAIIGVDEYKRVSSGIILVRQQQQWLNRTYLDYTGLCACDGVYSRSTNKALIYAVQAEEGMPTSMANGNFGPSTQAYCPRIGDTISGSGHNGAPYPASKLSSFWHIAQIALYCNGIDRYTKTEGSRYGMTAFDGSLGDGTLQALHLFQNDHCLVARNFIDLDEWMALLVSTGNPERTATACDCATQLTSIKAQRLRNEGFSIVGRYLTGTVGAGASKVAKNISREEAQRIFSSRMRFFAIYQDDADWWQNHDSLREYFSYERGYVDARKAVAAALSLGIESGEVIYFAVDYDYMAEEIAQRVIPHFQGINDYFSSVGRPYRVGIYGARNTCGTVWGNDLASSSFVSDMSTGYSGNLGYPLPLNWAFDQIKEYTLDAADGSFGVDKDVASGRYAGISSLLEGTSLTTANLTFKPLVGDASTSTILDVSWNDAWFSSPATSYNHSLATTASALATLAYSDAALVLQGLSMFRFGLDAITVDSVAGDDPVGYSFATKTLSNGSPLVVVTIRGTTSEAEWVSNMNVSGGASSTAVHLGFDRAEQSIRTNLSSWLDVRGIPMLGGTKYLVSGHSRGAAVANLLARRLTTVHGVATSNVFGYTFAAPNVIANPVSNSNIFNIINPEDFVPRIPLALWGFGKHGNLLVLPSASNRNPAEWASIYLAMRPIYESLTGTSHLAFAGGTSQTDDFQSALEECAPTVEAFYNDYGLMGLTPHEAFLVIARYVSGTANILELINALSNYPTLFPYFIINGGFNPSIFPGHAPEAYLAWMQSQSNPEVLFS